MELSTSSPAVSNVPVAATSFVPRTAARPSTVPSDSTVKVNAERPAARPTRETIQQAIDHSNKVLEAKAVGDLHFSVDKDTNISVVKLVDRKSGETIMQMPSEDMLKIAKSIDQFIGALVQKTA